MELIVGLLLPGAIFLVLLGGMVYGTLQLLSCMGVGRRRSSIDFLITWIFLLVAAHLPIAQLFIFPLLVLVPPFRQTGPHVEYIFAYFVFRSVISYLAIAAYCAILSLPLLHWARKTAGRDQPKT